MTTPTPAPAPDHVSVDQALAAYEAACAAEAQGDAAALAAAEQQLTAANTALATSQTALSTAQADDVTKTTELAASQTDDATKTAALTAALANVATLQAQLAADAAEIAKLESELPPTPQPPVVTPPAPIPAQPTGVDSVTGATITRYQDIPTKGSPAASGPGGQLSATLAASPTPAVSFPAETFTFVDMTDPGSPKGPNINPFGVWFRKVSAVLGSGADKTIFALAPGSQSIAPPGGFSPNAPTAGTNQQSLLRIDGHVHMADFTLQPGGAQTPGGNIKNGLCNGLLLYETVNGIVERFIVRAIPGATGTPPGETFAVNNMGGKHLILRDFELDGRGMFGMNASAALLGNNGGSVDLTCINGYFHDAMYSAGVTEYQQTGVYQFTKCHFKNLPKIACNFEQFGYTSPGTITFTGCQWENCGVDILLNCTVRSTIVKIEDPVLAPGQKIKVKIGPKYYYEQPAGGSPNLQKMSDVTLTIGGVVRNDLLTFVTA